MPSTFGEFLTFIGTATAIGAVINWVVQNWDFYQHQIRREVQVLILIVISTIMGVASMLAVRYVPAGVVAELEPYYRIVITSITIVLATQVTNGIVTIYRIQVLRLQLRAPTIEAKTSHG